MGPQESVRTAFAVSFAVAALALAPPALSQALTSEEVAERDKALNYAPPTDPPNDELTHEAPQVPEGLPVTAPLFIGVDNDTVPAYQVDVISNDFTESFTGAQVWGAAYDPARDAVFFLTGSTLNRWQVGAAAPVMLGTITDGLGAELTFVGLAYYNGVLYGVRNLANEAVYEINPESLVATVHIDYVDADYDFGGLAVDPRNGTFYGVNDDASPFQPGIFRINPNGTATLIALYPDGQTDVDGLAISHDGIAYLVIDQPGLIYVYDLDAGIFLAPLDNPWTTSEVFSAAAWIINADANIDYTKTVGIGGPGFCAPTDQIYVAPGTEVRFCYRIVNNGLDGLTFPLHSVEDSLSGVIADDLQFSLGPGDEVFFDVPAVINQSLTNTSTWTAATHPYYYLVNDNAPFNFEDISATGTPLDLSDDGEANVTMPFEFPFFENISSQLRIANNGGIIFGVTNGDVFAGNDPLPTTDFEMAIVPFWDDIDSDTGNVYYETRGTGLERRFIVQWHDRPHFNNSPGHVTFQAILFESGNEIVFNYLDVDFDNASWDFGASATIGLQASSTSAQQYSFNTASISNGMSIRYTPYNLAASGTDSATVYVESKIEVSPVPLESRQPPDTTRPRTLTISNTGSVDLDWELIEEVAPVPPAPTAGERAYVPMENRPVISSSADCALYEEYPGLEPLNYAEYCLDEPLSLPHPAADESPSGAAGNTAFALDIGFVSDNFVSHPLNNFSDQTLLGLNAQPIFAMDFSADGSTLYAIDNTSRELGTLSTFDGSFSVIATVSGVPAADNISGLAIDPNTNEAYVTVIGAEGMDLYTLTLDLAGATLIGSDNSVDLMIDITIGPNGTMYGHDIVTDSIYTINRTTGAASLVGPTGVNSNFAQGMDFNNANGRLYAWTYQGGGNNTYGLIDPATGHLTALNTNNPLGEFEGAIPNQSCDESDIPWATVSTSSGTTPPLDDDAVMVTFDSTGLSDGIYSGTICILSNDPQNSLISVPVMLEVDSELVLVDGFES